MIQVRYNGLVAMMYHGPFIQNMDINSVFVACNLQGRFWTNPQSHIIEQTVFYEAGCLLVLAPDQHSITASLRMRRDAFNPCTTVQNVNSCSVAQHCILHSATWRYILPDMTVQIIDIWNPTVSIISHHVFPPPCRSSLPPRWIG